MMWLTIMWLANDKEWTRSVCAVPTRPWLFSLAEPKLEVEAVHQRAVESECALEFANAHEEVREHD
jgi:hypothetical protein